MYIMSLKQFGVDVYTVKDGLLTPDLGDVMGMLKVSHAIWNGRKKQF